MRKYIFSTINILFLLSLISCSSTERKLSLKYNKLLSENKIDAALIVAQNKAFFKSKRSLILKHLELGMLYHIKNDYQKSIAELAIAKTISQKLYTVSISKKIATLFVNDAADNYYPLAYENSLIRFYMVLNNFLIYKNKSLPKKERRNALTAARANLLEWDSFQNTLQGTRLGTPRFKRDLLSYLLGAIVHKEIGSNAEKRLAMNLIKKTPMVLLRYYDFYESYNQSSEKFRKNYKKLPKMSEKKVRKKFVKNTIHAENILKYSSKLLKRKIHFVLQESFIPQIKIKHVNIPLFSAGNVSYGPDFVTFIRMILLISTGADLGISYELAYTPQVENDFNRYLLFTHTKKKKKYTITLNLAAPLADISYRSFEDEITPLRMKAAVRITAKHLAALLTAYAGYKAAIKAGQNKFLARIVATGVYAGLNSAIKSSEVADIRKWVGLPQNIFMSSVKMRAGEYQVKYIKKDFENLRVLKQKDLGIISINKSSSSQFHNFIVR